MEGQELSGVLVQGLLCCTGCPVAQFNVVLPLVTPCKHVCCFKQVSAKARPHKFTTGLVGDLERGLECL